VLTATYLHGSLLHILFNMMWLRQIGHWVEQLRITVIMVCSFGASPCGSAFPEPGSVPLNRCRLCFAEPQLFSFSGN
jgi:hypothetical protein